MMMSLGEVSWTAHSSPMRHRLSWKKCVVLSWTLVKTNYMKTRWKVVKSSFNVYKPYNSNIVKMASLQTHNVSHELGSAILIVKYIFKYLEKIYISLKNDKMSMQQCNI